jgi:predicted amidophosphoribosyltransferase
MRSQGPHICPQCGGRVTMFAAGCAVCGAELDPRRGQRPAITLTFPRRLRLGRKLRVRR